jgi:hypothetical protein
MIAFRCRSSYRSWDWEHIAADRFGFRICVEQLSMNGVRSMDSIMSNESGTRTWINLVEASDNC